MSGNHLFSCVYELEGSPRSDPKKIPAHDLAEEVFAPPAGLRRKFYEVAPRKFFLAEEVFSVLVRILVKLPEIACFLRTGGGVGS